MKKCILTLCFLPMIVRLMAQIPNNDFENWTTISADAPTGWDHSFGHVTKVTDKHSGSFAIKLQADLTGSNSGPGAILVGNSNDGINFTGGTPLAAKPDSLIVWAKYNITSGDSALVFLLTKKSGQTLSQEWYAITGASASYKRLAFKVNYLVSGKTPDSVILAFASTNFLSTADPNSWIELDDISFSGTALNIPDPGFENWTTKTHKTLDGWSNQYDVQQLMNGSTPTVVQTTDKATGNYAMIVQNNLVAGDTSWGQTHTGTDDNWFGPAFPVTGRKDTLYGLYKWAPQNGDSFQMTIQLFKAGNYCGGGFFINGVTQSSYKIFKIPVFYVNGSIVPDSATIAFNSYFTSNAPKGNSKLYVDNVNFNPVYGVGVDNITKKEQFIIYPNPANDKLKLVLSANATKQSAIISDMRGVEVKRISVNEEINVIDISDLATGTYIIRLSDTGAATRFVKR